MNIWSVLSLGIIFSTMTLQIINFKLFHEDGRNSTRITLMVKEVFFAGHALVLWYVTDVIRQNYPWWLAHAFGMLFFFGICCWFFVFLRGLTNLKNT